LKVETPVENGCFQINPVNFCGIDSYLIVPQIDAKWNADILHYRSLIVGELPL